MSLGGFDLHADEKAAHEALLTKLDGALSGMLLADVLGAEPGRILYGWTGRFQFS